MPRAAFLTTLAGYAHNSVVSRTGNVSAGTSIFAMLVLDKPLASPHREIGVVEPRPGDVAGFAAFLERYSAGLAAERSATEALR